MPGFADETCYSCSVSDNGQLLENELEFRPYAREYQEPVLELVRVALYGEGFPDLPGYWRWKHYENPFGESFGSVALVGGRLVAVRLFMLWRLCAEGKLLPTGRAVDAAVHPDWRRRGLFARMTLAHLEPMRAAGLALTFNTPNDASLAGYRKMGWAHLGRLPLRVRVCRPVAVGRGWWRLRRQELAGGSLLVRPSTEAAPGADNSEVGRLLAEPAVRQLVEEFAAAQLTTTHRAGAASGLRTALNPAYLEWHYAKNRWYRYAAAYESSGLQGALVIGRLRERRGLTEVLITEVVASEGRRGRALAARAAAQLAHQVKAHYLVVAATGETLGPRHGFIPVGKRGPSVTLRMLTEDLPVDPTSWAGWAAGIGDFELF